MSGLYLVIVILVLFVVGVALLFFRDQPSGRARPADTLYYQALHQLLSGRREAAYEKLKEVVRQDSDHLEAYIHLGNLLRERKSPQRALSVHQNLLHRPQLAPEVKNQVLQCIAQDYLAREDYRNAIASLEELTSFWKKDLEVYRQLLYLYEKDRQWDQALATKRLLLKQEGKKDDTLLALYQVQAGLELAARNQEHQARLKFREALHTDPRCPAAFLYLGQSYYREGRTDDAVKEWKNLVTQLPAYAFLVISSLAAAMRGQEAELEQLYRSVLQHHPREVHSLLALAEVHFRRGETADAIRLARQALEAKPRLLLAHCRLLRYQQDDARALDETLEKLSTLCSASQTYACRNCHHRTAEPLWRCPQCGQWQTFGI